MEESFELSSSMSPKVKGCQKHFRKGTTLLALKKNIRRSSIFDRLVHTPNNEELIIIEDSSTTDSHRSGGSQMNMMNKSPIVISDTDFSDAECDSKLSSSKKDNIINNRKVSPTKKSLLISNCLLSKDKLNDIKQWIDSVDMESEVKMDSIIYSELSTIYGDEVSDNFKSEGNGCAVNSTFAGTDNICFDKLFKNVKVANLKTEDVLLEETHNNLLSDIPQSFSDQTFTDLLDESLNTRLQKCKDKNKLDKENSKADLGKNFTDLSKSECNISFEQKNKKKNTADELKSNGSVDTNANENISDLVSMLDDLYGKEWRAKEEHVLPKTEPRKRQPRPNFIHVANSERKPNFSTLHKNPYTEGEKLTPSNLIRNIQKNKLKAQLESPWMQRLNDLCDSDSEPENPNKKPSLRMKLNFDEFDSSDMINKERKASKYFKTKTEKPIPTESKSHKENFNEFSYLGDYLEEKIQKKMNNLVDIPKKRSNKATKGEVKLLKRKPVTKKGSNKKTESSTSSTDSDRSNRNKVKERTDHKLGNTSSSESSEDEWEKRVSKLTRESKLVDGKYSFLASLSANVPLFQCDMSARIYRNNFKIYKDQLLKKLFSLYNENIFDNAIPEDTVFEWSDRMRGTAGYCSCKKITRRTGTVERTVRIVLATKVIDAAYRLRDTLVHELCHAASWVVNCVSDGHGKYWKAWAYKAMKTFPELPPIKRCHDYVINTKYTYKCVGCGYSIGRHTKSLDIERKRCGYCKGRFEVLLNKTSKKGETKSVPATPKKEATGFALFVKENYGKYKSPQLKHSEVMKVLGQKFQDFKINQ